MPITVTALSTVPIKGLRVVEAAELEITPTGPAGDRAFAVVQGDGHALVQTMRNPRLVQVAPRWDPASRVLELGLPGGERVADEVRPGDAASTKLYNDRVVHGHLVPGALSEALSDHLGRPVHLLALDPEQTGADDFPVTLMSTASLGAVEEAIGDGPIDPRRFRMTITVDGAEAWEEHEWGGSEIAVGDVVLRVDAPVPRCAVTTRDPDDGHGDIFVLKALAQLRGKKDVTFGVWCEVVTPGRIRLGDSVQLVDGGGGNRTPNSALQTQRVPVSTTPPAESEL